MEEFIKAVLLARDKGMIDIKEARELIRRKFNLFDKSDPSPGNEPNNNPRSADGKNRN